MGSAPKKPRTAEFLNSNMWEKIKFARQSMGMTKRDLAKKMGVATTSITCWEKQPNHPTGTARQPGATGLLLLSKTTGFPEDWFRDNKPPVLPDRLELEGRTKEAKAEKRGHHPAASSGMAQMIATIAAAIVAESPQGETDGVLFAAFQTLTAYRQTLHTSKISRHSGPGS